MCRNAIPSFDLELAETVQVTSSATQLLGRVCRSKSHAEILPGLIQSAVALHRTILMLADCVSQTFQDTVASHLFSGCMLEWNVTCRCEVTMLISSCLTYRYTDLGYIDSILQSSGISTVHSTCMMRLPMYAAVHLERIVSLPCMACMQDGNLPKVNVSSTLSCRRHEPLGTGTYHTLRIYDRCRCQHDVYIPYGSASAIVQVMPMTIMLCSDCHALQ